MPFILSYIVSIVAMAALDFLWIGVLFKNMYQKGLAPYLSQNFTLWAIVLFYLIYVGGAFYFAVLPAQSLVEAFGKGALLGFVAYSLYDLTNIGTFASWPVGLGFLDIFWGTLLTGIVSSAGYAVLQFFSK